MKGFLATKKGKVILAVFIALIVVIVGILVGVGNKKDSEESSGNKVNIGKETDGKDDEIGLQVVDPEDEDVSDNSVDFSELTEDDEKDTDKDGTPDAEDDDDDNDGTPDTEDDDDDNDGTPDADEDDDDNNGTPGENETNQPNTNVSQDTGSWGPFF